MNRVIDMYFVYSEDFFLMNQKIDEIIKKNQNKDNCEIKTFSLTEDDFNDIYDNVTNFSFFSDQTIIVISEAYFVNESKTSFNKNFSLTKLTEMIKNKNPNNIVIFSMNSNKFSKKLKIAKFIEQNCNVIYLKPYDQKQTIDYIIKYLNSKNKKIDNKLANEIYNYLPNDLQTITNELNKLASLSSELDLDIIKNVFAKYHQDDVFMLVDAFISNDISKFIKLYKDYVSINDDIIALISLLETNLTFYRDVLILKQQFLSQQEISSMLNSHPYRVKLAMNNKYNIKQLNDKIKIVYKIFKGIISSEMDKNIIVEYELIKNMGG
nr:DNA polymerase III subunit delta [Mycoplasma yeatsii]